MKKSAFGVVLLTLTMIGSSAAAEAKTETATVSRPCQASLGAPVREGNVIVLGQVKELCSSGRGYRLVLNHPEGLGGARFVTGSRTVILSDGRETLIADESGARRRSGPARIELDQIPNRTLAFSLVIAPK